MPQIAFRAAALLLILQAGGAFVSSSYAGQAAERRPAPAPAAQAAPGREAPMEIDAQKTREALIEVLQKHPPSVARVLRLDPSLMQNESYLATYPSLRQFLAQHPEIPQNAPFYLESVRGYQNEWQALNPRQEMVESTLAGLAAFTAIGIGLGTLIWLVRTVLEQRRWNRLSKIQAEVHSKLMDRFSSNDELMSYVQTPSGRRFLESGPSPLQEMPRASAMAAPFARILWSVQIGVVLLVGGLGMLYVSGRTFEEIREFFFICGCLAIALGAGFAVSAGASYALSRKLGLFDRPTIDHA